MDLLPQPQPGKFRKGPGKRGLGGDVGAPHETADAPETRRSLQGLHRGAGVGVVIYRLAHKGSGQGLALPRLPAKSLSWPTDKFLDVEHFQNAG